MMVADRRMVEMEKEEEGQALEGHQNAKCFPEWHMLFPRGRQSLPPANSVLLHNSIEF